MKTVTPQQGAHVCLAEMQSGGRGRRGRQWVSPFASNVYCSIKWQYDIDPVSLSGLSLALGVGLMRVLSATGCDHIGLKWPNDIYWNDKKMAGILLELSGDVNGPCQVVAGMGVNVRMPSTVQSDIDQPWTDLYSILGTHTPGRNTLAAALISEWIDILQCYPQQGFCHYQQEWNNWDIAAGRQVTLSSSTNEIKGIAQGVNNEGALLLDTDNGTKTYHAGEISLRMKT
jgi:BirA family biotin operon repressor/biotin-[acetyl-CoA-carboxylase] ligase